MKTGMVVGLALLLCGVLSGDDITLKDGRVLKGAVVKSEQTASITILHEGGLTSVSKTLLPEALKAKYPLDPVAVAKMKQADEQRVAERLETEARLKKQKEMAAQEKASSDSSSAAPTSANPELLCRSLAKDYFQNQYTKNPAYETKVEISISTPVPKEGWPNCWNFSGYAVIRQYDVQALAREQVNHPRPSIETPETIGKSAKELRRADLPPLVSAETRHFEATVTTGEGPASISVVLR